MDAMRESLRDWGLYGPVEGDPLAHMSLMVDSMSDEEVLAFCRVIERVKQAIAEESQ